MFNRLFSSEIIDGRKDSKSWVNTLPKKTLPDLESPKASTTSWLDTLSQTTGWFNPKSFSKNNLKILLLGTLGLSASVTASATDENEVCFLSRPPIDFDNTLFCDVKGMAQTLYKIAAAECGAHQVDPAYGDCAIWFTESMKFGKGFFGGEYCRLSTHITPDACTVDVLTKHVKNGFGTTDDIIITTALAGGATLLIGGTLCALFCCRKKSASAASEPEQGQESRPLIQGGGPGGYGLRVA